MYWNLYNTLENTIKSYNLILDNISIINDILLKFIFSLRINRSFDITKFFVTKVLDIFSFDFQYLGLSSDQLKKLMFDFILTLYQNNIIGYSNEDNSIAFDPKYKNDLVNLVYFSFDLMFLGNDKVNDTFDLSEDNIELNLNRLYYIFINGDDEKKVHINNTLISLVISSTVKEISVQKNINNIFIEDVKYGIANNNIFSN